MKFENALLLIKSLVLKFVRSPFFQVVINWILLLRSSLKKNFLAIPAFISLSIDTFRCNEATDDCFSPQGTPCHDGLWCNGLEFCDGQGNCLHTIPPCDTNLLCLNTCNETSQECNTPAGVECESDGIFCNGIEICDGFGGCYSPGDPCVEISTKECM